MMSFRYSHLAPKERAQRHTPSYRAAFMASLSAAVVLGGCGSPSKPANVGPTNTAKLMISADLPAGREGSGYSGNVTASGGTSPYSFALTSGQMPQGVNLYRGTGKVLGTPTGAG